MNEFSGISCVRDTIDDKRRAENKGNGAIRYELTVGHTLISFAQCTTSAVKELHIKVVGRVGGQHAFFAWFFILISHKMFRYCADMIRIRISWLQPPRNWENVENAPAYNTKKPRINKTIVRFSLDFVESKRAHQPNESLRRENDNNNKVSGKICSTSLPFCVRCERKTTASTSILGSMAI